MAFLQLEQMPQQELLPGLHVRFVHSQHMTLAYWNIEAQAELPEHAHPHEQVATILEGRFELTIDGTRQTLEPGAVALIPPEATHSGKALSSCRIIDVFYPIREDYR